jgi:hypothetical protein
MGDWKGRLAPSPGARAKIKKIGPGRVRKERSLLGRTLLAKPSFVGFPSRGGGVLSPRLGYCFFGEARKGGIPNRNKGQQTRRALIFRCT